MEQSSLMDDDAIRMRLDSEYVWEGGEDMYEDIVASTQPTLYLQPSRRKDVDMYSFYQPPPFLEELDQDMDYRDQVETRSQGPQEYEECQGSRCNQEKEEDYGLDSTFVSCLDFNQSFAPMNFENDLEMQDYDAFETFTFNSQQHSLSKQNSTEEEHSAFEDVTQIQTFEVGQHNYQTYRSLELPFNSNPSLITSIFRTPDAEGNPIQIPNKNKEEQKQNKFLTFDKFRPQVNNTLNMDPEMFSSAKMQTRTKKAQKKDTQYEVDQEEEKVPQKRLQATNDVEYAQLPVHHQPDKYYKKFDFFYKRTCFRLMSEFYKLMFQPFQKVWVEQKKRSAMIDLMHSFAIKHFESIMNKFTPNGQVEFVTMLMVVVHSHRHNKEDDFISETSIDFSLVRDTMYKYSKKAQERFFSYPVFAFLFAWFASSQEGLKFTYSKFASKGQEYFQRMKEEIDELKDEAVEWLQKTGVQKGDNKCQVLFNYFSS